jgi:SAM-dependent methyltransferase
MPDSKAPFDAFQPYYDFLVDWEHRLAFEAPFFQRVFSSAKARRVLDCACGTGHHALLFARWGLEAVGSDTSEAMVEEARRLAAAEHAPVRFQQADFRELADQFAEPFDAVICTGNSLPLADSREGLRQAVRGMHEVLSPGGVAVIHTLNYACLPEGQNVYEEPRVRVVEDREILFLKVARRTRQHADLDIIVLEKQAGEWKKVEARARAWALEQPELRDVATEAGFVRLQWYGGYDPKPFDADTSRDLILVARRRKGGE